MIELLVVIVIIGILATLAVVALSNARGKARDTARVSDMKQLQSALALYYTNEGSYPVIITSGQSLTGSITGQVYMKKIPSNPRPQSDGTCSADEYGYLLSSDSQYYALAYCLGADAGSVKAGTNCVTADSLAAIPGNLGFFPGNTGVLVNGKQSECPACVCGDCSILSCDGLSADFSVSAASCVVDNTTYNAVKIGSQCWMNQNVNIGQMITAPVAGNSSNMTDDTVLTKWCYENNETNSNPSSSSVGGCNTDGGLYVWSEAMYLPAACNYSWSSNCAPAVYLTGSGATAHRQGVCPKGWHVPSDLEKATMADTIDRAYGGDGVSGFASDKDATCVSACDSGDSESPYAYATSNLAGLLKCTTSGNPWAGCGASNLKMPYSGLWISSSDFGSRGSYGYYWTATNGSSQSIAIRYYFKNTAPSSTFYRSTGNAKPSNGLSVRCIRD